MNKSKLIISLFLLSQAMNTYSVYANSQISTTSEKDLVKTVVKKNVSVPQTQSVEAVSDSAVADVTDWQYVLEGTIVRINDYVGATGKEVKVPSVEDFKVQYPSVTEVSITRDAIRHSVVDRSATAFICDSPTTFNGNSLQLALGQYNFEKKIPEMNTNLKSVDLSGLDISNVEDLSYLFSGCYNLTSINLGNFDTSQVTDMSYMFDYCAHLLSLDGLSGFNTSKVTNMRYMFASCSRLRDFDLSSFDTSQVTDMSYMFFQCMDGLELGINLNLSSFDTNNANVTGMLKRSYVRSLTLPKGFDLTATELGYMYTNEKWGAVSNNQTYTTSELIALYDGIKETPGDTYIINKGSISLKQNSLTKEIGDDLNLSELLDNIRKLVDGSNQDRTDTDKDAVTIEVFEHGTTTEVALDEVTQKAGVYDIIYNYNGGVATLTLTVNPTQYSVTFAAGTGGSLTGNTSVKVNDGEKVIDLPTPEADSGYTFDGWYDANDNKVDPKTVAIDGNTTFTAKFVKDDTPSVTQYTVTFAASAGGSLTGDTSVKVNKGDKVTGLPTPKANSGYVFDGWYDANNNKVDPKTVAIDGNTTFTAKFVKDDTPSVTQYTVTFAASAGGSLTGNTSVKVNKGDKVTGLPTPKANSGYVFDGWYDANNNKVDPKTVAIDGNTTFTAKFVKNNTPSVTKVTMHRLYNPNSGEHFYTSSAYERDQLKKVGWKYEGTAWTAPNQGTPVYRMYNPNAGDHHYTASAYERDQLKKVGWKYEGIGWYSGGSTKVYRQYNPNAKSGAHNYTTSKFENDSLVKAGWRAEGIGWYGL